MTTQPRVKEKCPAKCATKIPQGETCISIIQGSRDRSPIYANAVNQVLPQAEQIADRFHLIKNIFEVLEKILHRERKTINLVSQEIRQTANRIS